MPEFRGSLMARHLFLALTAWLLSQPVWCDESVSSQLEGWLLKLESDPRVVREIIDFSHAGASLDEDFGETLAIDIRRLVVRDTSANIRNLMAGERTPFIHVEYPDAGFADLEGQPPEQIGERRFETGFIRTEVIALFDDSETSPESALRQYTAPGFRKTTSSQLKEITEENGLLCVETKGLRFVLEPTLSCNRVQELHRPGISVQHSQVVANPGGDDFQNVYFKESVKVFLSVPEGLALYYLNFTRTTDLGAMSRYVGRGKISQSQQKAIDEMQRFLNRESAR
jgi:hypothetical protein